MKANIQKFIKAFNDLKKLGEVVSNRVGNTGIGKTLEDIMNIKENNINAPDLHGFEIKSQRVLSSSYVTLFTKAPQPPKVNNKLRLKYGSNDKVFKDVKVLHTSVFVNKWNTHISGYSYCLRLDDNKNKLFLLVKKVSTNNIIEDNIYWDYETLNNIIVNKIQNLAFVQAKVIKKNEKECFKFISCKLYSGLTLQKFLDFCKNGYIMFDIRIGAYKNIKKKTYGKLHDHGSGFRIKKDKLINFYDNEQIL